MKRATTILLSSMALLHLSMGVLPAEAKASKNNAAKCQSLNSSLSSKRSQLQSLQAQLSGATDAKAIRKLQRKISTANKSINKTNSSLAKNSCSVVTTSVASSLRQLPAVSSVFSSRSLGASAVNVDGHPAASDVLGTPPTLTEIAQLSSVKDLFWRSGVVQRVANGTATQSDCSEFLQGATDGTSGGLVACQQAENVGLAFQPVLRAGTDICYMQNAFSAATLASGGITVVSGTLPDNDPTHIFATPAGSADRVVKVLFFHGDDEGDGDLHAASDGETKSIYFNVHSQSFDTANSLSYQAELAFCSSESEDDGEDEVHNLEQVKVTTGNLYTHISQGNGEHGNHNATITAKLLGDGFGNFTVDRTAAREAIVGYGLEHAGFALLSKIDVTADNHLQVSSLSQNEGVHNDRRYSDSIFQGTELADLRFLAGAFKSQFAEGSTVLHTGSGATEYRDPLYVAAPGSALVSAVQSVDLSSGFFANPASSTPNLGAYAGLCQQTPALVVKVNLDEPVLRAAVSSCARFRTGLEGMGFCQRDSLVRQARNHYRQSCPG